MLDNHKRTIFFITNNYKPYSSGIVSSIDVAAQALRDRGYRVIIVTLDFKDSTENSDVYRIFCPIKFNYKSNPMAVPFRAAAYLGKLIDQLQPILVHVHHPFLLGPMALRVVRKKRVPIVFTYHTLYERFVHYYVPLPQKIAQPIVSWLVGRFCSAVDGVIAPSQTVKRIIFDQHRARNITVIPSGILPLYVHRKMPDKKKNSKFELLSVSRFAPEKNIYFLLDVFKRLNHTDYTLTLVGYGIETESLRKYAASLLLPDGAVRFIIKPSKQELSDLYKRADGFIFASQAETQAIVLAEAMAHGTPVVALKGPGVNDIVISGVNGFLVDDQEGMIKVLNMLKDNRELQGILQRQAWKTAQEYLPECVGERLEVFYEKILGK